MLNRAKLTTLMTIGVFGALLLKIFEFTGLMEPIDLPFYIIVYPLAILLAHTDIILEKFGYHPNLFGPDDVPPLLWESIFILLVIAIVIALYLALSILNPSKRPKW